MGGKAVSSGTGPGTREGRRLRQGSGTREACRIGRGYEIR